ncbi:MAG: sensor histidine kinase KdpD [Chloroflexaceae bacterium]|jgi:two-component system sensor histidine kinase KdpD|nr:sensor histidine kinase KdpD [Chloroflexaceae bacterium]
MEHRPDPDKLLARMREEEQQQARGKLKVFFGMAAGVGKTYAMLETAHQRKREGVDVVAGYVETHRRQETEALLAGLEIIPRHVVEYRGTSLEEFNLDAALNRRPTLILVDELAHTNAPGSRHAKRWQDIEELLNAGISVYTTVNVQHLESLNDVVAQITGVIVRETVPDWVLEQADEVELIDLPPDDLLQRLREGKIYLPQQAERAIQSFFRKGNLIALRELALRRTADQVDVQMQDYRRDHAIAETWPANERLLVCVGPGPHGARLVRAARRMAARLRAGWLVLYVETPRHLRLPENERDRVVQTLRLAEQLGAETVTLSGQNVAEEVLSYARQRNVTKIVAGKPESPRWRELLFGSVVDSIVKNSGLIDVYVISGDFGDTEPPPAPPPETARNWLHYLWAFVIIEACTAVSWLLFRYNLEFSILVMIYLVGVVAVATRFGRGPSIFAAVLSVMSLNFFFTEPFFTLAVNDVRLWPSLVVMLLIGVIISTLTVRTRQQAEAARTRERRTAALYELSRDFASTRGLENLLQAAVKHISTTFESRIVVLLPVENNKLQPWGGVIGWWGTTVEERMVYAPDAGDQGVAQWVYEHGQMAGQGTDTLPGAEALYMPLVGSRGTVGVLGVLPGQPRRFQEPEQLHLLETFASQSALALERARLANEAQQAQLQIETERLRNSLLSSVSHDLRTPLAAITGAASSLLDEASSLDTTTRAELAQAVYDEAGRLNRLVGNLLDMTRLESGALQVQKEWQPLEEVVGAALTRLHQHLGNRPVVTDMPPDLPLVPLDGVLIEQVLINLLENALKYTPADSPLEIRAYLSQPRGSQPALQSVTVEVADRGPGIPHGDEGRIFEKFYRVNEVGSGRGVGLGLTICKGIVEAHGGQIWAENRPGGGSVFRFTLPLDGTPPKISEELQVTSNEFSAA